MGFFGRLGQVGYWVAVILAVLFGALSWACIMCGDTAAGLVLMVATPITYFVGKAFRYVLGG